MTTKPQFVILEPSECRAVLARSRVGRLAFLKDGEVDIEPIGYVASGEWIYFRSAYGAKLEALMHRPYAAFEVDEVMGPADWTSVVVHGTVYLMHADAGPWDRREYDAAVSALRQHAPAALTEDDPTPERDIIYGMHIDKCSGRSASSAKASRGGRRVPPPRRAPKRRGTPDGS